MAAYSNPTERALLSRVDRIEEEVGRIAECVCATTTNNNTSHQQQPATSARLAAVGPQWKTCCTVVNRDTSATTNASASGGQRNVYGYPASNGAVCAVPREPRVPPPLPNDTAGKEKYAIIGEIAFQLERRVFSYCFPAQTRFYGYSLRNVETLIAKDPDMDERLKQQRRFNRMINKLRQFGFLSYFHSELSSSLINQYGVLGNSASQVRNAILRTGMDDESYLREVIRCKVPCSLQNDVIIILCCLVALAKEDGEPLFRY